MILNCVCSFLQDSALDDMCGFTSLQSINIILKRILSKELANKYSYSGLGEKRKRTKLPFKNHVFLKHILGKKIYNYKLILLFLNN